MGMIFGYARVSTKEQNLDVQIKMLENYGCALIYSDKITGIAKSRPQLDKLLNVVREGDTIIVARFFRLGRSRDHLIDLLSEFRDRKIEFIALDLGVNTTTPAGKLILNIFSGLSEYMREEILEKTQAGRELAKANGKHMGRAGVNQESYAKVAKALQKNLSVPEIVDFTGISRSSVKRYRKMILAET